MKELRNGFSGSTVKGPFPLIFLSETLQSSESLVTPIDWTRGDTNKMGEQNIVLR